MNPRTNAPVGQSGSLGIVPGGYFDQRLHDAKVWPHNRNHEAARRHVNIVLRAHGKPDYSRRETHIAELLDELIRERDELRKAVYGK